MVGLALTLPMVMVDGAWAKTPAPTQAQIDAAKAAEIGRAHV